ncbi:RNA polymerase II subunit A C-terminal domain phosphatase Fcp1 [Rhynchophorus ferrugineus]|uniref:RNA polymerase II subunit A C-terminal domain phosphatase Fcp1 n=1 Tax=Rhynchophorus ferrugineus TaxID=354439 RepID=UPI003FCC4A8B
MADDVVRVSQQQTEAIKIKKWKVRKGITVSIGRILLIYEQTNAENPEQKKLKATRAGIIHQILAKEGDVVQPGDPLYEIKSCNHPTIMNDMCAECGTDLRKDDSPQITASVPMIHAIPDLKVSEEEAQQIGKADNERLIRDRKLVLLVDLDQTLIHTTNDNIPPNIKDVYHFQLYGSKSPWYHTRLRPRTHDFLQSIHDQYELHICTFGARNYAHMIAMFLDPEQKYFSSRILSRDECFDPTSKKANLRALFPCGDNMVCIIDDREDVWSHALNLIHVKPYHFFQHTGDINAPPGLDKHEDDDKPGVDLTNLVKDTEKNKKTDEHEDADTNNVEDDKEKPDEPAVDSTGHKETDTKTDAPSIDNPDNAVEKVEESMSLEVITSEEKNTEDEKEQSNKANEKLTKVENTESENTRKLKPDDNPTEQKKSIKEDNVIDVEDPDDYLSYLEDILKRIHQAFYEKFDTMESGKIPDLKQIIPSVRSRVLKGSKLVFSGLVPTHSSLEDSKAYQVARSLGAEVLLDLSDSATHLVAVRPGTAKVNAGRRRKSLKIVTPDWLWSCAERWEHVDERIFPLNSKGSKNRHPPPHCSSPEHIPSYPEHETPGLRKRTLSGRFMDTINPLMSFSRDDIANMDKEVEDILDDESDSDGDNLQSTQIDNEEEDDTDVEEAKFAHMIQTEILDPHNQELNASSTSGIAKSLKKKTKRKRLLENENIKEELPSQRFRRGEYVDDELENVDRDPDDNDSDSFGAPEESDGEWNMMGAALEREFLSD